MQSTMATDTVVVAEAVLNAVKTLTAGASDAAGINKARLKEAGGCEGG